MTSKSIVKMLKKVFLIIYIFSLTYSLSAGIKAVDWLALEEEACILENIIDDVESEIFPENLIQDKDPETKMPEIGFLYSTYQRSIFYIQSICRFTPFVQAIICFSGFTNLANAP